MEVVFFVGLFIMVVIVAIQTIGDIVKRKYQFENRTEGASQEALARKSKQISTHSKKVLMK